ncbi:MAG: hypothetical protein ACREHC_06115 [Candidatus Levyibacteriota bacterium]
MPKIISFIIKHCNSLAFIIIGFNILFNAWTILHNDIIFNSDIARDFLLLNEISQKKIILIGPRADGIQGLFHGPLWLYLNYPAYYIGHGNPVVVGWFWLILTIIFLLVSYIIATKLFNRTVGMIYLTLLSSVMVYYSNNLFNPDGAMFVLPIFFYFYAMYYKYKKFLYLTLSLLLVGLMIQFQMAIGLPILILASILTWYLIIKNKIYSHVLAFLILLLPMSTFILFDIRHNFEQLNSIIKSFAGHTIAPKISLINRMNNRIETMTSQLFFFRDPFSSLNILLSYFVAYFLLIKLKINSSHRYLYILFIYFFFGFYLVSLLFNGNLLQFFVYPLIPLVFLFFSSNIHTNNSKKLFMYLIAIIIIFQIVSSVMYIKGTYKNINFDSSSWQFQHNIALRVFSSSENSFGYFIYAPDVYGYKQNYAFMYTKQFFPNKNVTLFKKQRITYVIVEPIPGNRQDLASDYLLWKKHKAAFRGNLLSTFTYPNGYRIEKYRLTDKEIDAPIDSTLLDIIHFR